MGNVTVHVDDKVEAEFRRNAAIKTGYQNRSLGQEVTEAMRLYNKEYGKQET